MSTIKKSKSSNRKRYYVLVYITLDGKIYLDCSNRNKNNKIIFQRVDATEIINDEKNRGWNINNEIRKVDFNLEKFGLELDNAPVEMVLDKRITDTYYFTVPKKIPQSRINENLILLDLEDFLADEEILNSEKLAVIKFFNGDSQDKWL